MAIARDRKLYLGPRLRMLRRELGLNQTQMAEELGVSPSYLNHLERNQRPLTAPMLLRLAETYDLDVRGFVAGAGEAAASDLGEILADDLTRDLGIGRQEALEVAENYPNMAEAVKRLYRALADLRQLPGRVEAGIAQGGTASPIAWSRDWLRARDHHFGDLDAAAEALSAELGTGPEAIRAGAVQRLLDHHGVGVRVVPQETLAGSSRHYDYHRRRLLLSERLSPETRAFAIAAQLAQTECGAATAAALAEAAPPDAETAALARQILANYAAAAIVMPYARLHAAAEAGGYDLDLLAARFGASVEQVAHRLTTLGRSSMRGLPLFLLKLDAAGNVVKRAAGTGAPIATYGGGCPRWRVHRALSRGGETVVDLVETPGGDRTLTWARAVRSFPRHEPTLLVMGCDAREAARTVYAAQAAATPTPIGPACHLCERVACPERALPPLTRSLTLDAFSRPLDRYAFRAA